MSNCPYCGTPGNFYFASYSRSYYRCLGCDLLYRNIPASYNDVVATYRENYFERYSAEQLEGHRFRLYDHILDLIGDFRRGGTLLDVGAGCGFFLVAAQKRGWGISGGDLEGFTMIQFNRYLFLATVIPAG